MKSLTAPTTEQVPLFAANTLTKARVVFALGGMMLFVVALSIFYFAGQSLRLDESQSLWQTSRSAADIIRLVAQDVHVPLYHELLHFWRLYVGDSVAAARFLSLSFYLLSIPALYLLGALAYNRATGLFAALLFSISPFMNWYGNEVRMYALFTFLVIISQYCFIKIWKDDRSPAWLGYAASALLGVFTHYFFFLVLVSQAVFFLFRRDLFHRAALSRFFAIWGLVGLAFAPWAYFVFMQGQAQYQQPLLAAPSTVNLFSAFSQFLFGFQSDHLNTFFLSLWPVTVIFGFLGLRKTSALRPETEYFLLTVLLSVTLAFFASFVVPVFVSRYLIFTVPSLFLVLISLFSLYGPRAATVAKWALAGLMLLTLGIEIASPSTPVKEDYRDAVSYLGEHANAQDVIVLSAPFTIYPVDYYYRGPATLETLPRWDRYAYGPIPPFSPDKLPEEVKNISEHHRYAWLLLSYDQGYQRDIKKYFDDHYSRVAEVAFSPGLELYAYQISYR